MTLYESRPEVSEMMASIGEGMRAIRESGGEPRFVVVGPVAYARLRVAVAEAFGREEADVEQVQWMTVVVDPSREDRLVVLPVVREVAAGVRVEADS